jgi:pimeloyl-ACP methyl ester carboxylesterase
VSDIPEWFYQAMATPYDERWVDVDGVPIHCLDWGKPDLPGLVLVHGGAAHAHWWTPLAPMFMGKWHVVALDLSGHGDSGRRSTYSHQAWAREVMAVVDDAAFPGPPVLVGHSLGGMVTIQTASDFGDRLRGAVLVDTPVLRPAPEEEEGTRGRAFRAPGTYPDLDTALKHFRLIPPQPCDNDFVVDHIARHSLRETESGWTWKFDPVLFQHALVPLRDQLATVKCRVALFRGQHSVTVPEDTADYMYELMDRKAPVVTIPEAHHHLILDQPLAFVAALRTLLADWDHSTPHHAANPRSLFHR